MYLEGVGLIIDVHDVHGASLMHLLRKGTKVYIDSRIGMQLSTHVRI